MKTEIKLGSAILLAVLALPCTLPVHAATPREQGGGEALRKMQYMMQKLSTEKSALEQENLRLAEELKKAQSELETARSKHDKTEQARVSVQVRNEALLERVRSDSERITDLRAVHGKELGDARADIQLLNKAVQERETWINDCQAKNDNLYKVNAELLDHYRKKGVWSALKQGEPVTGIGSVRVENVVQDYQFRLEDLRTVKFESGDGRKQSSADGK